MTTPINRTTFAQYCLERLGHPVIDINIDETQIDNAIDDALQYFEERHANGTERTYIKYQLTQDDIDNEYIIMANNVIAVYNVLRSGSSGTFINNLWHMQQDMAYEISFSHDVTSGSYLTSYGITNLYYSQLMDMIQSSFPIHEFNIHTGKLQIFQNWSETFTEGDYIVMDAYISLDPDTTIKVWNDRWLKNYAVALIGIQWGVNLSKFENVSLPGGITLDGDKLFDRYNLMKTDIEEKYSYEYEPMPEMLIG